MDVSEKVQGNKVHSRVQAVVASKGELLLSKSVSLAIKMLRTRAVETGINAWSRDGHRWRLGARPCEFFFFKKNYEQRNVPLQSTAAQTTLPLNGCTQE